MTNAPPQATFLKDYSAPPYRIARVDLDFALDATATRVRSVMQIVVQGTVPQPLVLDGERLELMSVAVDGRALGPADYALSEGNLTLLHPPARNFTLAIETVCNPSANTELSGLYLSNGIFCTQCEAEGFRRITYFQDRPDVMAQYRVRIEAAAAACPILLSNGNPQEAGVVPGSDRHYAVWDDPHPKPSYLFALVAGKLASVTGSFTTRSGRAVALGIYVEDGNEGRCAWALDSLKASMRWDEERFGREYDLDVFNIVAVPHFNMGAMENKGLNIFNDKYILALPGTATDADYINIERIVAHEYFHNWTGNRITCRDWFQLCLKEGLTVYRDQEFSSDLRSRAVKRIADVKTLLARQFPEDGGPLAHPVRPERYIEINNFYTATVYEKGAEICRMLATLIGPEAFSRAMDLYFERHDGSAATVEDFVACTADASGRDLAQFFRWYQQAGTPRLSASGHYDAKAKTYTLTVEQSTPPTPGEDAKQPLHIPLGIGLIDPAGEDLPLDLEGVGALNAPLIELRAEKATFRFRNVPRRPVLSLNRDFTAPVILRTDATESDRLFQLAHDRDSFNRWEAGQAVAMGLALRTLAGESADPSAFAEALRKVLEDGQIDAAFKAQLLQIPTEADIAAALGSTVDPDQILAVRDQLRRTLGTALQDVLLAIWEATRDTGAYRPDPDGTGRRALRYAALPYLLLADARTGERLARAELAEPRHMTAEIGVTSALIQTHLACRDEALQQFHDRHAGDHLLIDKWFMLQAVSVGCDAAQVRALLGHPAFAFRVPNRVHALLSSFTSANPARFHAADGTGYAVVAEAISEADRLNPQVAARLATGFRSWRMMTADRQNAARAALQTILERPGLSRDCFEIVSKIAAA